MTWQLIGNIAGRPGTDGADGKDADLSVIAGLRTDIDGLEKAVLTATTAPNDEDIRALVVKHVAEAVSALPPAKDGVSVTVDDVAPMIASEVKKSVAVLPEPVGVTGAVLDRSGHLVLTFSDGSTKDVGEVAGRDVDVDAVRKMVLDEVAKIPRPADGINGADGLGFEDLDVQFDEATGYVLRFARGELVKKFPVAIPWDAGIWEAGKVYPKGAGLRRDGSWWIAQTQTSAQPGHDKTWRLAVKKGTDGRQGIQGIEGTRGPKGEQGMPGPARY